MYFFIIEKIKRFQIRRNTNNTENNAFSWFKVIILFKLVTHAHTSAHSCT